MTAQHLQIGALVFPGIDQLDLAGPFEVLSRLPDSTFHLVWKERAPVRDARGLLLTPEMTLADCPPLDVLVVPGGSGQIALMEDGLILDFLRTQGANAQCVFSVCTGALTCGAAGLLRGVRATTHWASFHLLASLGAIPVPERVVEDGRFVCAAGVTAGIDGALRLAARLRGVEVAQRLQLYMQYAPEPPFDSGTPETAPVEVLAAAREALRDVTEARREVVERIRGSGR